MKNKRYIALFMLGLGTLGMQAQNWPAPTTESKPGARWWWLGSALTEKDVKWNMEQYASHGLGALEITPLYGVQGNDKNNIPFLSPKWMQMLQFIEGEGKKDGIEIDMNCGTGWPFGGPNVAPTDGACKAIFIDKNVEAEKKKSVISLNLKVENEKDAASAILQKVMAYDQANGTATDITAYAKDGILTWKPGTKGAWRIVALYAGRTRQMVKRAAPGGNGLVIDHFDAGAVGRYLKTFDEAFSKNNVAYPHTFFNDSYEVFGANWTPTLLDEFAKRRGYKLEDHLTSLIDIYKKDAKYTDADIKVLSDYRETLADMLLYNFTNQWADWAHSHGSIVRNQAHGSPANLIDLYSAVDIPEIEGFGLSDFGIKGLRKDPGKTRKNDSDFSMLKYAPSAAHINGKPYTSSETFTWLTEHFRTSLSQMKPDMDLMFVAGVNHMFFHGTCYSPKDDPWPGWKFYASVDMSPTNSIWRDAPYFLSYIQRCQSFLQMGKPDNDFLVYLPIRDMWAKPDKSMLMMFAIHSMGQKSPEFRKTILDIDAMGYDCDYISDKYLLTTQMKGGQLQTAAGIPYRGIVIPEGAHLTAELKAHLDQLKAQGAHVIYGLNEKEMAQAAKAEEIRYPQDNWGLKTIRRSNDKGHHYFIANLTPRDMKGYAKFSTDFQDAIWFDPVDGKRYKVESKDGKILVDLKSGESMILQTFNSPLAASDVEGLTVKPRISENATTIDITNNPWTLSFTEEAPKVDQTFKLDKLQTWENLDNDSVKVTMGTGVYTTNVKLTAKQLKDAKGWMIDLGDVRESARVYVNGKLLGCAWSVPYQLDLGKAFKPGVNTLRIEVTNLPANRIADLDRRGVKWRKFEEINVVDINYKKTTYENWEPVPSGLNSTVKLVKY